MVPGSMVCVDPPCRSLLMGASSDVASKRLRVLHIRPNLPETNRVWT